MIEYVYCIYEECHGLIGIWTDEAKARAKVDRISKNCDDIDPDDWFNDGRCYGNGVVHYEKTKVNVEW